MKQIFLGSEVFALVDDEDYDYLNKFTWHISKTPHNFYAIRNRLAWEDKSVIPFTIRMHRMIMNICDTKILIDHLDHNGLNNQKSNLRTCNNVENGQNRRASRYGTSKYLGVHLKKGHRIKKWGVSIKTNKKIIPLGYYEKEEDAAKVYDEAAKKYHGKFANLNFK